MTVKEVFELRKQGRIEEAYEAIRPMYAAHRGRYTTLCMFWTAADVFKLRLEQGRVEEATKILEALRRMLPRVEAINKDLDSEKGTATTAAPQERLPWEHDDKKQEGSSAAAFIASATRRLEKARKGKSDKKAPLGATDNSRGCMVCPASLTSEPTATAPTPELKPRRGDTPPANGVLTGSTGEKQLPAPTADTVSTGLPVDSDSVLTDSIGEKEIPTAPIITRTDLNAPQRIVLACLVAHPGYSVPQISESTGIPAKSVERHISALIDRGLIEHRGSKKSGGYHAL